MTNHPFRCRCKDCRDEQPSPWWGVEVTPDELVAACREFMAANPEPTVTEGAQS